MSVMDTAHALVVGIAAYQHIPPLPRTILQDALDIHDVLIAPEYCGYPPGQVQVLLDAEATAAGLRAAFARLAHQAQPESTVFIYLSSHGGRIESGAHAGQYLWPVDVDYRSDEAMVASAIAGAELTGLLSAIPARKLIVVLDCCHAGGLSGLPGASSSDFRPGMAQQYYETLQDGRGRAVFASSRGDEVSYVLPDAPNSLFTTHLLAGLKGGAPGPGGFIRVLDLFSYVQPRVTADQPRQHPYFQVALDENFPVALYLGATDPGVGPAPADGFAYDVFLSYYGKDPDKTWVRKTLLPRLQAEGLKACIDYRDFRLGAPRIAEIERAVEQSRYTLAVLTANYTQDPFNDLENGLAQYLGTEQRQVRFMAILHDQTTPKLSIRFRQALEMTDDMDDADLAAALRNLVYQLRQPVGR
ncbi:MAG TPA: caspase family protein [Chloroflexia bacterium]|nr:caspase family protein [Chloroflexia bacterium]